MVCEILREKAFKFVFTGPSRNGRLCFLNVVGLNVVNNAISSESSSPRPR